MNYSREQLINALVAEWEYLCHDDFDPGVDLTPEEYLEFIEPLSYEELVLETGTDQEYTLDDYMNHWEQLNDS